VTDGEGAGDTGKEGAEVESVAHGRFGVDAIAELDVIREVVVVRGEERIEEAGLAGIEDAPGGNPLAADNILELGGLFEEENGVAGTGEDGREAGTGDAAADDDGVVR
jgi:hypothetical protein